MRFCGFSGLLIVYRYEHNASVIGNRIYCRNAVYERGLEPNRTARGRSEGGPVGHNEKTWNSPHYHAQSSIEWDFLREAADRRHGPKTWEKKVFVCMIMKSKKVNGPIANIKKNRVRNQFLRTNIRKTRTAHQFSCTLIIFCFKEIKEIVESIQNMFLPRWYHIELLPVFFLCVPVALRSFANLTIIIDI